MLQLLRVYVLYVGGMTLWTVPPMVHGYFYMEQIKLLTTMGCCLMRLKYARKLGRPT